MKTFHVTIRLGVGPDDDGAFDKLTIADLHNALMRAFPLTWGHTIEVEETDIIDLALCGCEACERLRPVRIEISAGEAAADSEIVHSLRQGGDS